MSGVRIHWTIGIAILLGLAPVLLADPGEPAAISALREAQRGKEPDACREAWRRVAETCSPADLPLLFDPLAESPPKDGTAPDEAIVEILGRGLDATAAHRIGDVLPGLPPAVRSRLYACLGQTGSPEAARLLADRIENESAVSAALLAALAAVPREHLPPELFPRVLPLLDSRDPMVAKQAVLLLGHGKDLEAAEPLIGLLGSSDRGLRDNALWALRQISGCGFPADAGRWRLWLRQETARKYRNAEGGGGAAGSGAPGIALPPAPRGKAASPATAPAPDDDHLTTPFLVGGILALLLVLGAAVLVLRRTPAKAGREGPITIQTRPLSARFRR